MANRNKKVQKKYEASKEASTNKNDDLSCSKGKGNKFRGKTRSGYNDISWYVTDPQILNDVSRIPYSIPVGYPMTRRGKLTQDIIEAGYDDAVPGIAAMGLAPTIGNAEHANDAVNVAANGMYTFVRHLNSGSRNYDANDLIIYCMAVNCVYYVISWATRIYATLQLYAQGNRYLPDALLCAQGVYPNDIRANMAQFRAGINQRIRKISTLVVPGVLPIFARHSWLFSNYFIEGESIKDQIYMFYPVTWYKFTHDSDEAGMLKAFSMGGTGPDGLKVTQDILDILDEMIDPIFNDEDFNIVSGDILKAYGESNILKLALIPDELPINLAYSEEVLLQFKNAKVASVRLTNNAGMTGIKRRSYVGDMFNVYQSTGKTYLYVERDASAISQIHDFDGSTYEIGSSAAFTKIALQAYFNEWSKQTLLTSPHADVQPAENMINTRLTLAFNITYDDDPDSPNGARIENMYFGSEWPMALRFWCYHRDRETGENVLFYRNFRRVMMISPTKSNSVKPCVTSYLPIRSSFKYAPELAIIENDSYKDEDEQDVVVINETGRVLFEVDNYTLVDYNVIGLMHNAAIQGEYNIPRIALFPTK